MELLHSPRMPPGPAATMLSLLICSTHLCPALPQPTGTRDKWTVPASPQHSPQPRANSPSSRHVTNFSAACLAVQQVHSFPLSLQNTQCTLHLPGGETSSKMCGLRQLDVANGDSGIKSWKPSRCRPFHCKCVATKEVQRTKRTIADNKTTLDYHRYRVYECV